MQEVDVDKMLARIGNRQFNEWVAFYLLEEEDAAKERKEAARNNKNSSTITL